MVKIRKQSDETNYRQNHHFRTTHIEIRYMKASQVRGSSSETKISKLTYISTHSHSTFSKFRRICLKMPTNETIFKGVPRLSARTRQGFSWIPGSSVKLLKIISRKWLPWVFETLLCNCLLQEDFCNQVLGIFVGTFHDSFKAFLHKTEASPCKPPKFTMSLLFIFAYHHRTRIFQMNQPTSSQNQVFKLRTLSNELLADGNTISWM